MGICVSCRRRDRKAPEKRAASAGLAAAGRGPYKGAAAELLPRRADPAMANSISNIKMTNPIKGIVSKRRKRYIKDGFNLDLAYITDRLIAMGFPAEKLEGVYRNHIDEVYRFLENKHQNHYKIYNLCSERSYDSSKFHDRVVRYAFDDHAPPKMELIQPFCEDVDNWLKEDPRNVAAVHCKAGKGRTGTMVCCYLLYSGEHSTADEALKFYGTKRTHDEKGVTIPSQRRYVEYYEALVKRRLLYAPAHGRLHVRELLLRPPPQLNGAQALELIVSQAQPPIKLGGCLGDIRRATSAARLALDQCIVLSGDVCVDVVAKQKMTNKKLFHFWFNTFFVANCVGAERIPAPADSIHLETFKLTLNKWQLDDAHKDKHHKYFDSDFQVELIVQKPPDSSTFSAREPRPLPLPEPEPEPLVPALHPALLPAPAVQPLAFPALDQAAGLDPPSPPSDGSSSDPDTEPDAHWDSGMQYDVMIPLDACGSHDEPQNIHFRRNVRRDICVQPDVFNSVNKYSVLTNESEHDGDYLKEKVKSKKNKKHSFFNKHDEKEKGKIPKVSSDHTISDDSKKKYTVFNRKEEDRNKPRLSLGDMRASWREFSGKWTENRKKKDRDSS